MRSSNVKFGVALEKMSEGSYSVGVCISSEDWDGEREFYLFINLFKWTLSIGRLLK